MTPAGLSKGRLTQPCAELGSPFIPTQRVAEFTRVDDEVELRDTKGVADLIRQLGGDGQQWCNWNGKVINISRSHCRWDRARHSEALQLPARSIAVVSGASFAENHGGPVGPPRRQADSEPLD